MTDKQINKWLRRQFTVVGWVLVLYYILLNVMVSVVAVFDTMTQILKNAVLGENLMDLDMDALMNNGWGYIVCIAVGLVILHAWKGPDYWRQEIFVKERKMTFFVFFCALSFCMGSQMLSSLWLTGLELLMNCFDSSVMPLLESVSGSTDSFSMFLYGSILAPISEEILFRGYVLRTLRPYGRRFSIVGSALLFGLFHGNLLQGPYAFLVGLVLGWLACEYSIKWAIALHMFNNLLLADVLTRVTDLLPEVVAEVIHLLLFGGFLVVSCVILFQKRREIARYNRGEWIDRRCVRCLLTSSGFLVLAVMMTVSMIALLMV